MKESKHNAKFREQLDRMGFLVHRIESHTTSPGAPDNHYIHKFPPGSGTTGWIEVKAEAVPPTRINFRPKQPLWLVEYAAWGGKCFVFVFVESDDSVIIIHGRDAREAEHNLSSVPKRIVSLRSPGAWEVIKRILLLGSLD